MLVCQFRFSREYLEEGPGKTGKEAEMLKKTPRREGASPGVQEMVPRKSYSSMGPKLIDLEADARGISGERMKAEYEKFVLAARKFVKEKVFGGAESRVPEKLDGEAVRKIAGAAYWAVWRAEGGAAYAPTKFLSDAFDPKNRKLYLDCDTAAVVMADVLRGFGISAKIVEVPEHALLSIGAGGGKWFYAESSGSPGQRPDSPSYLTVYESERDLLKKYRVKQSESELNPLAKECHPQGYVLAGEAYIERGKYAEAAEALTRAIALSAGSAGHYALRAHAYGSMGKHSKAVADYTKALETEPSDTNYYNRGNNYMGLGEYRRAMDDYTQALLINPRMGYAYHNRAICREQLGERKAALEDAEKARALEPNGRLARALGAELRGAP